MFPAPKPKIKQLHMIINSSKKDTLESVETFNTPFDQTQTFTIIIANYLYTVCL